jgi:Clr5 domain
MAPPKIDFEIHKDLLHNLYVVERRLMADVRQYMKTIHNFNARYTILLLLSK